MLVPGRRQDAHEMTRRSLEDYRERFPEIVEIFDEWDANK
jgi:hypothetical protein